LPADLQPSSVLSDATIRELIESGRIVIEPFDPSMVQPASVDIRLGNSFRVFHNHRIKSIDLGNPPRDLTEHVEVGDDGEFVIHPGEFVLGRTHELVEIPDDVVCRIEGKALALDTEIPTADGWSTMGAIEVGDRVFAPTGHPRTVVAATEVMEGRPCFEISFSDGAKVTADAEHQWFVTGQHRLRSQILSTEAMFELGVKSGLRDYRFRVPDVRAVLQPEKEFVGNRGVAVKTETLTETTVSYGRAIVGIRRVPSVPVRCIQVDDPMGLYLITKSFLPTHNSSIGRLGLVVHATAGFVDPGFKGTLTLEITNFNSVPIVLRPGLAICQLSFMALDRPAERPYGHPDLGSHYYGQVEATESRYRA
jgi:deoxycytidine triphosphate deaminase